MDFDTILKTLKAFQDKFPTCHVGGSVGLALHGIDLKRELSDLDITIDEPPPLIIDIKELYDSSDSSDFDYSYRHYPIENNSDYIKIEVRVNPEPSFIVINKDGINYNVSKLRDIIFWKKKYSEKGYQKHTDDLVVINGGERPAPKPVLNTEILDDLPF